MQVDLNKEVATDKPALYRQLCSELTALIAGEPNWIANTANAAALLWLRLPELNWAGFYFVDDQPPGQSQGNPPEKTLILGPFQGKPACVRIPFGKGVCGTAAATRTTQLVPDVHQFPGHIACDAASQSEIVIPLVKNGDVIGVLDLDSPLAGRFDEQDQKELEIFSRILLGATA